MAATAQTRFQRRRRRSGDTEPRKKKDMRWWRDETVEAGEVHSSVFSNVESISHRTAARRRQDLYFACLYDDAELASLIDGAQAVGEFVPQTMSHNIVRRQVDTYTAQITKNRPVPMGLTTAGNYSQQRRAKTLSKYFEGELDNVKFWETRMLRRRDSAIFGDGFAHNYRIGEKRYHDRFYPWELRVDPREAQYGKPRTIYLRRFIDRLVLKERFPKFAEEIEQADSRTDEDMLEIGYDETSDLVLAVWAWHLPSGPEASDGAFALCISNADLEVAEYKRDYFPFSKGAFSPPLVGWWGEGMVKQLSGLQYEVNAIGLRLQEQGYLTGSYVWVPDGSGIETDVLDNGALTLIRSAQKPEFFQPAPWHPQFFQYYMALRGQFPGETTGQSGLATRAEKPPGLNSGEAVRRFHTVDSENLVVQGRIDEQDVIDTCWQLLDLAEEVYGEKNKAGETYTIKAETRRHGRNLLEEINYADVRLDREQFTLRVFPTSFLATTPEDRWSQVQEMIKAGFLSQDEAMSLMDFPDLQRVMNLRGAARRNIERLLERIIEADDPEKAYEVPLPAWNLELCKALALTTYLDAKLDGVPEENLKWVLQFANDAQAILDGGDAGATGQGAADATAEAQADAGAPIEGQQYAPPDEAPLPANAIAPETMAALPPPPV